MGEAEKRDGETMTIEEIIYKQALDRFGGQSQMMMCIEEMAELIQAFNKLLRNPTDENHVRVCEEIADVSVMINQMRIIFDEKIIDDFKQKKLLRLKERIESCRMK